MIVLRCLLLSVFLWLLFRFWACYDGTRSRYNFVRHGRMWVHVSLSLSCALSRSKADKVVSFFFLLGWVLQVLAWCVDDDVVGIAHGVLLSFRNTIAFIKSLVALFDLIEHISLGGQILFITHGSLATAFVEILTAASHDLLIVVSGRVYLLKLGLTCDLWFALVTGS